MVRTVRAARIGIGRVAAEAASFDDRLFGQQRGQRPDHGGLGGPLLAPDQHPAHLGRHRGEDQGQRHVVGSDDGGERERTHCLASLLAGVHARGS